MNFHEWWATLSPKEQLILGTNNARFVWQQAREACAKDIFEMCKEGLWDVEGMKQHWKERNKP